MKTQLQRVDDAQHQTEVHPEGSLSVNQTHQMVHLHDGATAGGTPLGMPVRLQGPTEIVQGNQATYTIVDYNAFATYQVSVANGTATLSGDTITYTSPGTGATDQLIVSRNGVSRAFMIDLATLGLDGVYTELSGGATARYYHSAVALDGNMYVFGGYSSSRLNDLWEYTPQTDSWQQLTSGATVRNGHSATALGGKMYIFGGYGTTGYRNDLWEYDPTTDVWQQLASGATTRYRHSAVAIDGNMYVFGGSGTTGYLNDLWQIT